MSESYTYGPSTRSIRIKRCPKYGSLFIRTLENVVYGVFIHWFSFKANKKIKWRSEHCTQPEREGICSRCARGDPQTWKGYTSVQVYDGRYWAPFLLELTGPAALDLTVSMEPNQVWEIIDRGRSSEHEESPLACNFLKTETFADAPEPFNVAAILTRAYGHTVQAIRIPNPTTRPERGVVSIGPTPDGYRPNKPRRMEETPTDDSPRAGEDQYIKMREQMKRSFGGIGKTAE